MTTRPSWAAPGRGQGDPVLARRLPPRFGQVKARPANGRSPGQLPCNAFRAATDGRSAGPRLPSLQTWLTGRDGFGAVRGDS